MNEISDYLKNVRNLLMFIEMDMIQLFLKVLIIYSNIYSFKIFFLYNSGLFYFEYDTFIVMSKKPQKACYFETI